MLAQLLIIVFGVSLLSLITPPVQVNIDTSWHTFSSGYLLAQSQAIRYGIGNEYVSQVGQRVSFKGGGNVPFPRLLLLRCAHSKSANMQGNVW